MKDIYDVVERDEGWFSEQVSKAFSEELGLKLIANLSPRDTGVQPTLRLSALGDRCPHARWLSIHSPSLQEPLPAQARIKFAYGHVIEALAISMAKAAGHEVTGEQDVVHCHGIKGHRDCVIDGCIVDVKSSSSQSFSKFKDGSIRENDTFGYLDQLDGYIVASAQDPLVTVKDRGYLLVIDKQLGHFCLYEHILRPESIEKKIAEAKAIVELSSPPACTCGIEKDGESGNFKLDLRASYNGYKHACMESRGIKLRTFLYSNGPRFLTTVIRRPKRKDGSYITEVDKDGKVVYNV